MAKEITKKSNYIKLMAVVFVAALFLTGCKSQVKNEVNNGDNTTTAESSMVETEATTITEEVTEAAANEGTTATSSTTAEETTTITTTTAAEATAIRPDFKEAMDSYEAFIDEYIAFMKKYQNASATEMLGMLSDYTDYLEKYGEAVAKMQEWEGDLNDEEMKYYLEVMTRINKKLTDAAIA